MKDQFRWGSWVPGKGGKRKRDESTQWEKKYKREGGKEFRGTSSQLLYLLGDKEAGAFVLQADKAESLVRAILEDLDEKKIDLQKKELSLGPLTPIGGRKMATGPKGTPYKEAYSISVREKNQDAPVSSLTIFKTLTPKKENGRPSGFIRFNPVPQDSLKEFEKNPLDHFYFIVTREVLERVEKKRGSQNGLMGASARECFASLGAEIVEKGQGRNYHWAHRQGHG